MENEKKAWETPELIVLVRSKPEEAVLAACKPSVSGGATGPSDKSGAIVAELEKLINADCGRQLDIA